MREQHSNGHLFAPWIGAGKFRNRGLDRHIEPHFSLLVENHRRRRRGDRLRDRGKIVNRILVDSLGIRLVGKAANAGQCNKIIALCDREARSGEGFFRDALLENLKGPRKTFRLPTIGVF
jgi:hypothetical protein